jgi:hypothetical protein
MRSDNHEFSYSLDAARVYQSRASVASIHSPASSYAQELPTVTTGEIPGHFRHYQTNGFTYGAKGYFPTVPGWTNAYGEDVTEYSMNYPQYSCYAQEPSQVIPYRLAGNGKQHVTGGIYDDNESSYTYSSGGESTIFTRTTLSPDSPRLPYHGTSNNVPATLASNQRQLATPVTRLVTNSLATVPRNDVPIYSISPKHEPGTPTTLTIGHSTLAESPVGYGSFDSNTTLSSTLDDPKQAMNIGTTNSCPTEPYLGTSGSETYYSPTIASARKQERCVELAYRLPNASRRECLAVSSEDGFISTGTPFNIQEPADSDAKEHNISSSNATTMVYMLPAESSNPASSPSGRRASESPAVGETGKSDNHHRSAVSLRTA